MRGQFRKRPRWKIDAWRRRLEPYLGHPGYVVLVASIAALNAFIPFFPVELFLVLRILVRPRDWLGLTLIAVTASALANAGLARLIDQEAHASLTSWLALHWGQASWERVSGFVHHRGSMGLMFVAVSFLPLPPAVVMCALAKIPGWKIAFSIGTGHCIKYGFFAAMAAYSPSWFGGHRRTSLP